MATVTEWKLIERDWLLRVDVSYDDISGRLHSATVTNDTTSPVTLGLFNTNSGTLVRSFDFPPGATTVNVPGNRRLADIVFNVGLVG